MILDYKNAEALSQIACDTGWGNVGQYCFRKATLAGVIELARAAYLSGEQAMVAAHDCLKNTGQNAAREYINVVNIFKGEFSANLPRDRIFASPTIECWLVKSPLCIESNEFLLYIQRFQRSMRERGFGEKLALSLSKAVTEMAENVVRHSNVAASNPTFGVVAFHVSNETMNYIVADAGRGVLASLRENPQWRHLTNERDALLAVSKEGATRIAANKLGDGFRQTIKSFIDYEGVLALRSGDGSLKLSGKMDSPAATIETTAHISGLRVAAFCSLKGTSAEIHFDY